VLKTEERNAKTTHIDKMSTDEMLAIMQEENVNAVNAVALAQKSISRAVDEIALRLSKGGRLFYVGCGTSGRLGVLDASECPPTFGVPNDLVVGIIAGGDKALRNAIEGAEDNLIAGEKDLALYNITPNDSVVGISVAGGAEYVLGAIAQAKNCGALTIGISSNEGSTLLAITDIPIYTDTGAEVITGSSRLKAGTAHKMILNMISTAVMIKQGYVYENLMINLQPTNKKLKQRMVRITATLTNTSEETALSLLEENGFNIRRTVTAYKQNSTL
jgi:N-acetylmuramic acid 6-phosphate etherase